MLLIPSLKRKTGQQPIDAIRDPVDFYLPLDAYGGAMMPLITQGERVLKYQSIAALGGVFATKLHAPVSGTVKSIYSVSEKQFIHLQNDFKEEEIETQPADVAALTLDGFTTILNEYGIEGAGGARFPTQLKFRLNERPVETLIFNGVECEPYLSADAVLMKEKANELLQTAQLLQTITNAKRIVFVLEKANRDIQTVLRHVTNKTNIKIETCLVPNTYPQGGELQVIKTVTGIEIKKGIVPIDHAVLVNNVGTLWAIYKAVFEGKPYTERVMTISGNRSTHQGNYLVKIGTPVAHLLKETQNNWHPEKHTVVLGGAMMGKAVHSLSTPVNKGTAGMLVLKKQKPRNVNCIKCGECVTACPQRLMPFEFVTHQSSAAALQELHLKSCIECGACAYVCPSDVPLMESIANGKKMLHK